MFSLVLTWNNLIWYALDCHTKHIVAIEQTEMNEIEANENEANEIDANEIEVEENGVNENGVNENGVNEVEVINEMRVDENIELRNKMNKMIETAERIDVEAERRLNLKRR